MEKGVLAALLLSFPFDGSLSINLGHKVMHNPSFNSKKFKGRKKQQQLLIERRMANFSSTAHSSSSFLNP